MKENHLYVEIGLIALGMASDKKCMLECERQSHSQVRVLRPGTVFKWTLYKADWPGILFSQDLTGYDNSDLGQPGMRHLLLLVAPACSSVPLWLCYHRTKGWVGKENVIPRNELQMVAWWWSRHMACWLNASVIKDRTGVLERNTHWEDVKIKYPTLYS